MVTFDEVVRVLTNIKIPCEDKKKFIEKHELSGNDIIGVINIVTIERDFYKRRCEKLNFKLKLRLK